MVFKMLYKVKEINQHLHLEHVFIQSNLAAMQGAGQHIRSSLGVQDLAPGHFYMQAKGIEPVTFQ